MRDLRPMSHHASSCPDTRGRRTRGALALGLLVGLALLAGACSSEFNPFVEGPPYFALDAALDSRDDTLFVRVQDVSVPPGAPVLPLESTVTLTDLATGTEAVLRDSIARLDGGGLGHLFWTTARLLDGRTYRLRAVRDADPQAVSEATIDLPPASVTVVSGEDTSAPRLDFSGRRPVGSVVTVTYQVRRIDTGQTATVTSRYSASDTNGQVIIPLGADANAIAGALGLPKDDPQQRAAVTDVTVEYLAVAPGPIRVVDGRGQISWRALLVADWRVPAAALEAAGLRDGQG